ncbi:MAG: hypothetical protein IJV31_12530 [Clostridia bacterium]|nr:hypothetical protein [Clostridia bacterium]
MKVINGQDKRVGEIAFTHLTDDLPENGEILRMIDKKSTHKISGSYGEIEIPSSRETTHLAACSEVANADFSSWDDKKIGIIIPLEGLPKDLNVTSYNPADFQIKDKVQIPEGAYIICPKDMAQEARQKNPGINVLPYEGQNVRGLVNSALVYLGYEYEWLGTLGFIDFLDNGATRNRYIEEIADHFGIKEENINLTPHCHTDEIKLD